MMDRPPDFTRSFVFFAIIFPLVFGQLQTVRKGGILLENSQTAQFVPIPLPWGVHGDPARFLNLTVLARTTANDATLLTAHSKEKDIAFTLAIRKRQILFSLMVGGETVGESLDEVVDENETTKVDISIDFDAMVVFVNGQKLPYNAEPLPRNDDSLWIDLGGDNSHVACIGIRELRVSGVQIKLEYGTPIGLKYCDPGDELEIAEESLDKDLVDDRGQGHTDNSEHENSVDKQDKEQILEKTKEMDEINEENNGDASEVDPNQAEKQFEKEKIQEQSEFEKSNQENMAKKLDELLNQPEILNDFAATTAKSADPEVPNCLPHQRAACGSNFRNCVGIRNSEGRLFEHKFNCICKSGFSGKFCQFSLLPRSCFEAFALNTGTVNEPGVYELDVDGSGPLMPTWAFCNRDAVTVVEHNMPNDTIIRTTAEESDKFFPISYKFFPQPQLKKLIGNSFSCKQSVAYKCQNAALGFATNQTWFDVASGKVVKHIGSKADQCPCAEENCLDKKKCNCDSLQETADEGILYGEESGITTVFAVRNVDGNGMGKMTLSALECEGNAGHFPENSITFKSAAAALNHTTPEPVEYFEFEFRTIQDDIESLVTQQQGELTAQISLLDAYTLQLKITENGVPLAQSTVKSQSKISDLRWHRILVEVIRDQVRFAVDDLNDIQNLENKTLPSKIVFGSYQESDGFVGCIRSVTINQKKVPINDFEKNLPTFFGNMCPNLCSGHNCEQESKCIEHFDSGKRSCQCKNRFIHRGERCEKNLNFGSEVSFHDHQVGFLRYSNVELASNPLLSTLALSFRTDQKRAVLVYVHDQSDNLLQIHLADEYRVVLTLSNYTGDHTASILTCTVFSYKHAEFSDMRWLQIVVERSADRVTLAVNEEQCEIRGNIVLAPVEETINDYGTESRDIIFPPRAAGHVKVLEPFQYLFIGGVKSQLGFDRRKKRALGPLYQSFIPVFLGCMKGLVVGEEFVNMKQGGVRPEDPEAVQAGCYTECDSLVCHNGGHCTFLWENQNPTIKELTSCDCSKTSYFGSSCLKDIGITFDGSQTLLYKFADSHNMDLHYNSEQTFRFAFSPQVGRQQLQRIVTIFFEDQTELQVALQANDSISVVYTGMEDQVFIFPGNFSDGYRHFFQATFAKKDNLRIVIDSVKQYFPPNLRLHLATAVSFRFGGLFDSQDVFDGYHGCLSNVDLDFHRNSKTVFQPLVSYFNSSINTSQYLISEPDPQIVFQSSNCSQFFVPGILPSLQRNVQFPEWDAEFNPVSFQSNFTVAPTEAPSDGPSWWLWILLALILILLIICCCLICCRRKERPPPIGTGAVPDEQIPLKNVKTEPESPVSVQDNFEIPKATEPLFKNGDMLTDRPPIPATEVPNPPESKEYPDEVDSNLDSMDAYSHDDEDIDGQLSRAFGEERPNVLDKKMYNLLEKTNPKRVNSFGKEDSKPSRNNGDQPRHLTPVDIPRISTDYINGV